jgi:hypothetical protein
LVDNGNGFDAVLREEVGDFGLISVGRDGIDFCGHDVLDRFLGIGGDEILECHDAEQSLVFVKYVGVVNGFDVAELLAEIADGFVDGSIGAQTGETGIHKATGDVFAEGKESFYFLLGFVVEEIEQVLALGFVGFLDEVGGVIGGDEAHIEAAFAFGEGEEKAGLCASVKSEEEVVHLFAREGLKAGEALQRAEAGPKVEQFVGSVEGVGWHRGSGASAPGGVERRLGILDGEVISPGGQRIVEIL